MTMTILIDPERAKAEEERSTRAEPAPEVAPTSIPAFGASGAPVQKRKLGEEDEHGVLEAIALKKQAAAQEALDRSSERIEMAQKELERVQKTMEEVQKKLVEARVRKDSDLAAYQTAVGEFVKLASAGKERRTN